jgi:hypothetical protein
VIDDFTAVVNRHAAWAMCASISRFIRHRGFKQVVFASSCGDVVKWLQPDWVVVLAPDRSARMYKNPALGGPSECFRPAVTVTYKLDTTASEMQEQYEHSWALKTAEVRVCKRMGDLSLFLLVHRAGMICIFM